jgi:hypothetical protein
MQEVTFSASAIAVVSFCLIFCRCYRLLKLPSVGVQCSASGESGSPLLVKQEEKNILYERKVKELVNTAHLWQWFCQIVHASELQGIPEVLVFIEILRKLWKYSNFMNMIDVSFFYKIVRCFHWWCWITSWLISFVVKCSVQKIALVLLRTCKFEVFLGGDDMQIRCACSVHKPRITKTFKNFKCHTFFQFWDLILAQVNCIAYNFIDIFTNTST